MEQNSTQFYAYMWTRADGTPWYIGKGSGKRAFVQHAHFYPPKDKSKIFIFPRASEAEAFETEKELIRNWGRLDNGTGCLHNLTDGGENPPRAKKGRKLSAQARRNISLSKIGKPNLKARGKKRSEETIQKMSKPRSYHWTLSEETKQNLSVSATIREAKMKAQGIQRGQVVGFKHDDEAKKKMSEAKKGKPSWNKGIPQTPEHIAKLSAVRKGKRKGIPRPPHVMAALHSPEAIAKATAARTGRKMSAEAKRNMSIAALKREAKKREKSEL